MQAVHEDGTAVKGFPVRRQLHPACRAVEQFDPQRLLEALQIVTQCRLGNVQSFRCRHERAGFGNDHELFPGFVHKLLPSHKEIL